MPATERIAPAEFGLTADEYSRICQVLEREPNDLELGMFGVLWSEHCSYKHSRPLLSRLPTEGPQVLQGPGENAGAVDIGDGLAAVMKIESHNHPSAVEPFQGAATGVGGILRDIFTMGARPIALMDVLCFGEAAHPRTGYLLNGVVGGISFYGNCVGVPTVGGSIAFDASYSGNPLVNVLCLGLVERDKLLTARASGAGNSVLLVGSATGRDGIAGASFASAELSEESEGKRPAVQVGNPFLEKLLIEACLELAGDPDVVAMQDLGAAGLTGAATEVAASGGCGIDVDVARVSRREAGMTPTEVMLSESQERMLVVVRRGAEERIGAIFQRWELESDVVGHITDDGLVRVRDGSRLVAEVPARFLSRGAPEFNGVAQRPVIPSVARDPFPPAADSPSSAQKEPEFLGGEDSSPAAQNDSYILLELLGSPNLCSRRSVFEQYDHTVQTNTVVPPGQGAAVLRVKGTRKGLALGLGGSGRLCAADPQVGGALAVAEACRNVSCAGARPIALTDCLNFGDPERPEVWRSLERVVEGMSEACLTLDVPIISGNVSLYNETDGVPVKPTPIVGALGLLEDVERHARATFAGGKSIFLLGPLEASLDWSELAALRGWSGGPAPSLDLDLERRVQQCVRELVAAGVVSAANDVAEGGLAVALAEMALAGDVGLRGEPSWADEIGGGALGPADAVLFGEAPSRIIVSCPEAQSDEVEAAALRLNIPATRLGMTGGRMIEVGRMSVPLDEARAAHEAGLARISRV